MSCCVLSDAMDLCVKWVFIWSYSRPRPQNAWPILPSQVVINFDWLTGFTFNPSAAVYPHFHMYWTTRRNNSLVYTYQRTIEQVFISSLIGQILFSQMSLDKFFLFILYFFLFISVFFSHFNNFYFRWLLLTHVYRQEVEGVSRLLLNENSSVKQHDSHLSLNVKLWLWLGDLRGTMVLLVALAWKLML